MARKLTALEFETIHNNRLFLVEYFLLFDGSTILMKILHNDLPIDTVNLDLHDRELAEHINNAMANNAESYLEDKVASN